MRNENESEAVSPDMSLIDSAASTVVVVGIGRRTVAAMAAMRDGLFKECRKAPGTMVTGWTDGKGAVPGMWPGMPPRLASQELYGVVQRLLLGTMVARNTVACDAATALELLGNELEGTRVKVRTSVGFDIEGSLSAEDAAGVRKMFEKYSEPGQDGDECQHPVVELYGTLDEAVSEGPVTHVANGDMGILGHTPVDFLILIEVDLVSPTSEEVRRFDGVLRTASSITGMRPVLTDVFPADTGSQAHMWEAVSRQVGRIIPAGGACIGCPDSSPLHGLEFTVSASVRVSGALVNRALRKYLSENYTLMPAWTYTECTPLIEPVASEVKGECNAQ